jgi:hypothetical protein
MSIKALWAFRDLRIAVGFTQGTLRRQRKLAAGYEPRTG